MNKAHLTPSNPPNDARLDVMNFLNEVAGRYPAAISFASGRPAEEFFDFEGMLQLVPRFAQYFADQQGFDLAKAYKILAQYGKTKGIINDLIARQVKADEGIVCQGADILLTGGCQEALDLIVNAVCQQPEDVILVRSPCYIGITGVADLNQIGLQPFDCDDVTQAATALEQAIEAARQQGKKPKLLYLVPEFDNPTGSVLPLAVRQQMIQICHQHGIFILEDNPYGMFRFEGERMPPMFALDPHGVVIYLGTYSKTLCPALRVGFAIVPQQFDQQRGQQWMDKLSQAKSFVSVNTSQLTQAVVGALLLEHDCSLGQRVAPALALYRQNRDAMLAALQLHFDKFDGQVRWNVPEGGFFLILDLPFVFKQREAEICAKEYGVLTMPLSFFALNNLQDQRLRLAFSNVSLARIDQGIARLAQFVQDTLQNRHAHNQT